MVKLVTIIFETELFFFCIFKSLFVQKKIILMKIQIYYHIGFKKN